MLAVSHPTLGHRPPDMTAAYPADAERLRRATRPVAARALEVAVDLDPTFSSRYDEAGLRHLLRDLETYIDRVTRSVASGDARWAREWAEWVTPVYRRRRIPMDDLITLSEGLRQAAAAIVEAGAREPMDAALDEAIAVFHWHRSLAGDARKRNRVLNFLYRGA